MPTLQEILRDPNYINANPATKQAIFERWAPQDTNFTSANGATQTAIRQRFGVGMAAEPEMEQPKDEGFFTNVGKLAFEGGERAIGAAKVSPSVISGNVGKEQAKGIAEQLAMKPTVQPKELTEVTTAFKDEAEALQKAQGFKESVGPTLQFMAEFGKQALTNPKGVAYLTAQSAANMAPSILGMIVGGKSGAALGTMAAPGPGTVVGGVTGAIAGGFAGSAPMEIGAEFIDNVGKELRARGMEPTQENVEALLSDRAFVQKAVGEARTKGTTTAAVDAVMTAGAGRYATGPRRAAIKAAQTEMGAAADAAAVAKRAEEILKQGTKAERAGRAVKRGAGAVGIDVAGGGLSEAAGQYAAYGEVDPESVALEMLGELGGSAIEVPSAAYATGRDALKAKAKSDAAKILEQERAAAEQPAAPPVKEAAKAPEETSIEDLERTAGIASVTEEPKTVEDLIAGETPAKPQKFVRVYHSGSQGEGQTGRWASTDKKYASNYRPDLPLYFTDIPADDPRVNNPDYPDQGVNQGFTFNFELTPQEAAGLKEIPREQKKEDYVSPLDSMRARKEKEAAEAAAPAVEETPQEKFDRLSSKIARMTDAFRDGFITNKEFEAYKAELEAARQAAKEAPLGESQLSAAKLEILDLADKIEAAGNKSFAEGMRLVARPNAKEPTQQIMEFYRSKLPSSKKEEVASEPVVYGLAEAFAQKPKDAKLASELRKSGQPKVRIALDEINDTIQSLADTISAAGYKVDQVIAGQVPPAILRLRNEINALAGLAGRLSNGAIAVQRGYKLADKQRVKADIEAAIAGVEKAEQLISVQPNVPSVAEQMEGRAAPISTEVEGLQQERKKIDEDIRRIKNRSASLWTTLTGRLSAEEVRGLGGRSMQVGKNQFLKLKAKRGKPSTDLSTLVANGELDAFLPFKKRSDSDSFDEQESTEYIREKLASGDYITQETQRAVEELGLEALALEQRIQEELSLEDINREIQVASDEQREADQAVADFASEGETGAAAERQAEEATELDDLEKRAADAGIDVEAIREQAYYDTRGEEDALYERTLADRLRGALDAQEQFLAVQTEKDLKAKEELRKAKEKAEQERKRADEEKAKADEAAADFVLTGSDRAADQAAARGQMELAPAEEPTREERFAPVQKLAEKLLDKGTVRYEDVEYEGKLYQARTRTFEGKLFGSELRQVQDAIGNAKEVTLINQEDRVMTLQFTGKFVGEGRNVRIMDTQYVPTEEEVARGEEVLSEQNEAAREAYYKASKEGADVAKYKFSRLLDAANSSGSPVNVWSFDGELRSMAWDQTPPKYARLVATVNPEEKLKTAEKGQTGYGIDPEEQRVEKELTGKTMIQAADWAIQNAPNAFVKTIAEKVRNRLRELERRGVKLEFEVVGGDRRPVSLYDARGYMQPSWGDDTKGTTLRLVLNGAAVLDNQRGYPPGTRYSTVLHELLHVATRGYLQFAPLSDPLRRQMRDLTNAIIERYNSDAKAGKLPPVMQKYYKRMNNVLESDDEVLAWGLTDEEVQKYFADIKVGEKSAMTRLVELVRSVLGLGKPYESALDRLVKVSESMLDMDVSTIDEILGNAGKRLGETKATTGEQQALFQKEGVEFREDIPNESWLQEKIDYAQRSPRNEFGVPKMSSVTGYFKGPVMVPARWLKDAKGQRGEEKNVRQKDLEAIRKIIRDTGKFPLNEDGAEYVPYIEIGYDGKPWVSEGNHRIMAAIAEGMEYIPIELRYFDGGQRRAGVWGPGNVASITENAALTSNDTLRQREGRTPQTETAAFKRWFGDSKIVDADGNPRVMYHGTTGNFETFEKRGGAIFVTPSKAFANKFAMDDMLWTEGDTGQAPTGANVLPVYVRAENPFDFENASDVRKVSQLLDPADRARFKSGSSTGRWQDIEDFIDSIEEAGFDGAYILEQGVKNLAVFDPKQLKSAIGNQGTFDPNDPNILRQQEGRKNALGEVVLGNWTEPTETKMAGELGKDDIIYWLQDKMVDTKRVVEAITSQAGKIATRWNPYLQEELYHGRTAKQTQDFLSKELRPLMQEMQKNDVTIGEFEQYLHNRHAEEYNKQVAKVNPNDPEMQDGGSGITNEDARKYLKDLPADKKKLYESLADKLDGITKGTRELLVKSGLESRETIDAWEKAFPDYVPLHREDVDFQYTTSSTGTGQGFDVRGPFSRRAMGSKRKVVDILANVAMQRERAIVKANKNRVAEAVYGLAVQNANPDFWLAVNPLAEKMPEAAMDELRAMGIDESAIEFLMQEPRQRAIDPKKNEVMSRINAMLRNNDNVLSMRFNGENRYVFFNPNNERSARAAKALKNLDADQLSYVIGSIAKITRWMASVNTQYNPIFGAYNFLRDVQGAALQLTDTPLAGKQKEVMANSIPAIRAIYASMRKARKGEEVDTEMSKLWNDFQEAGGQTGFRDMFSRSQERAEALQKEFRQMSEGKIKSAGRATLNWLSDYNDTMENAVRLSAYKVALDSGISRDEAASIAKNLTVNFNRKGQVATQAGALYAFFNAAVQGTARLAQTLTGPGGRKIIAGGMLLGVMQASLLAMAGFDEEEPPEFVRERNFIIPIGGNKYLTFPMPLGYHVIPGTSRILTEWALGGFKNTSERIASLTGMYLEAFNPIGNAGWSVQSIAPTFADPLVALAENKDWTGKPIARKDFSNLDPTPGYTRAKDTASWFSTQIAKFLNYASGGTKYQPGVISPTPDQIDYLIGQATGGLGREALKIEQTITKTATGEELPPYKIPVVGRFYGETKSSAAESNRFYKNLEHLNKLENEIKGRKEHKEPMGTFMADNPEARLIKRAEETYSDVKKLRQRKEKLLERNAPRESIKAVENQITMKMRMLNEQVEKAKK